MCIGMPNSPSTSMARHAITTPLAPVTPTISGGRVDAGRSAFAAMIYSLVVALPRFHIPYVCSKLYPTRAPACQPL
jgi:hypothetical protein